MISFFRNFEADFQGPMGIHGPSHVSTWPWSVLRIGQDGQDGPDGFRIEWFMSWHQLWYIESHNYFLQRRNLIGLWIRFISDPLYSSLKSSESKNQQEFPETAAKKGEIEVRKLKDIKGQKAPKLSDRGHPKPTIKKLIEENRGNYQILLATKNNRMTRTKLKKSKL